MAAAPDGVERLRGVARKLLWGALVCLLLPALAWLGTALWEELVPPTAGHSAGILAVALVLAPVGLVLLVLGLAATGWARWLGRRQASGDGRIEAKR